MGFTSEVFLFLFLPASAGIYFITRLFRSRKAEKIVLLLLSYVFYYWADAETFLLFLLAPIFLWAYGSLIESSSRVAEGEKKPRKWIALGAVFLGVYLFAAKYLAFVAEQVKLAGGAEWNLKPIVVPIGVSFLVFEAISYLTDIYRGDAGAGSFLDAALFFSLFPKLVSGPIVRWKDFAVQTGEEAAVRDVAGGVDRILIGYAKKAILADTFGARIAAIDAAMALGDAGDLQTVWLRAFLYFFQIYYDFSGYSDIAIGLSRVFGFSFRENFDFPYLSTSVTEFWRRWHISLGTWFREYIYIPMGGNRRGNVYFNLFVVFLLTGIWHGANWTFLVWGAFNGLFVVLERLYLKSKWYAKIPKVILWLPTMFLVGLGWVIFSSADLPTAFATIGRMFTLMPEPFNFSWRYYMTIKLAVLLGIAALGSVAGAIPEKIRKAPVLSSAPALVIRRILLLALFGVAVLFIVNSTYSPFLYFQF